MRVKSSLLYLEFQHLGWLVCGMSNFVGLFHVKVNFAGDTVRVLYVNPTETANKSDVIQYQT